MSNEKTATQYEAQISSLLLKINSLEAEVDNLKNPQIQVNVQPGPGKLKAKVQVIGKIDVVLNDIPVGERGPWLPKGGYKAKDGSFKENYNPPIQFTSIPEETKIMSLIEKQVAGYLKLAESEFKPNAVHTAKF